MAFNRKYWMTTFYGWGKLYVILSSGFDEYDEEDYEDIPITNVSTNGTLIFTKTLQNFTRDPGKMVKMICEVQNLNVNTTKVTFIWLKSNAPIERSKRISIKTIKENDKYKSILRITDLEYFDKGFYDCIANNTLERIKSQAILDINNDLAKFGSTSSNALRSDEIDPDSTGDMTTFLPNAHNSRQEGLLPPDLTHTASSNSIQFELDADGKLLPQNPNHKFRNNFTEPFCQIYSGHRCKDLLENKYVFVQPPYTQFEIEEKLNSAFLVISGSNDISSSCNKFVYPSMCYSAFPICIDPKSINTYQAEMLIKNRERLSNESFKNMRNTLKTYLRRMCKSDCLLLETELCSKEYAIAKRHPVIGQIPELEECELLPDDIEDASRNCLGLGVELQNVNKDDNCYWDDGRLYRGIQDKSISGKNCLRWSHLFIDMTNYQELAGHNYCRNPGGLESQPFCYIDQNTKETCGLTKCAHIVILAAVISFVIVTMLVGIIVTYYCCRRKKVAKNLRNMNTPTADKNIYGNPGPNSPIEMNSLLPPNIPPQRNQHSTKGGGVANVPQYSHKEVAFVEELGEGAFGKVYKGELKMKNGGRTFVAVKSLKENASAKTQADFQREIELISELKHPNIICLLGVVLKQDPICMLFEYMSEGDLHEFLIANSPNEGKSLSQNQFLHIAIQIAQGMEYLSENHYVHRDLAARNCLVTGELVVKISDFGLSRDMYSCDYYRVQSKSLLPVRWMPPESILYGKFTTESDVWSYGVVLWEIYSYGLQPYYGFNNQEVINMIRSRKLLPCPESCPSFCYALMVECWAELAVRRPTFSEITHRLRVWKQQQNSCSLPNGTAMIPYYRTPEHTLSSHNKYGHSSKSGGSSEQTVCEGNLRKSGKLNASQSSLTSRGSSVGNKTQSTSLSSETKKKSAEKRMRKEESLERHRNPKNTVVNANGDNFEIKLTM